MRPHAPRARVRPVSFPAHLIMLGKLGNKGKRILCAGRPPRSTASTSCATPSACTSTTLSLTSSGASAPASQATATAKSASASAATAPAPLHSLTESYQFCVQLATVLDTVKRVMRELGPSAGQDAAVVGPVAAQCRLDPFASSVARVAEAVEVLHTLGPTVCPVQYFVRRFQEFVAAEAVVELSTHHLLSIARREVLGSRAECLLRHVATAEGVTPLLACYLNARREDVATIVDSVGIPAGVIDLDRRAPDAAAAARDTPSAVSRMVCPGYMGSHSPLSAPLCVPEDLLPCIRRLALLDSDRRPPLILVASGRDGHPLDFVLETFVDLAVVPGAVRVLNLMEEEAPSGSTAAAAAAAAACSPAGTAAAPPSSTAMLSPADIEGLEACIRSGVPVVIRTSGGVPTALALHARLRLHVMHVRKGVLDRHLQDQGFAPVTRVSWGAHHGRRLWDAVAACPGLGAQPLPTPPWRPAAPAVLHGPGTKGPPGRGDPDPEDVALLSEMLHTGQEGVQLCQGATALVKDVAAAYAAYRRRRGYFRAAAAPGGITAEAITAAACVVSDLWDEGLAVGYLAPVGCVCGVQCRPHAGGAPDMDLDAAMEA